MNFFDAAAAVRGCECAFKKVVLYRSWEALSSCTRCSSLAVLNREGALMLAGAALPIAEPWSQADLGSIGSRSMSDGRGNYLANLALYPGISSGLITWHCTSLNLESLHGLSCTPNKSTAWMIGVQASASAGNFIQCVHASSHRTAFPPFWAVFTKASAPIHDIQIVTLHLFILLKHLGAHA